MNKKETEKILQKFKGMSERVVIRRIHLFQNRIKSLREKIIPLQEKIVEYTEEWVKAMQLNQLHLLEAQKRLLQSRKQYWIALMEFKHALADLELHLGGGLMEIH